MKGKGASRPLSFIAMRSADKDILTIFQHSETMGNPAGNIAKVAWRMPLALALAYGALAAVSLATTQTASGIAVIWPSSGIFLAGLMLLRGQARIWLIGLVSMASVAANYSFGASVLTALGYTLSNVIEGLVAARIVLGGNRAWGRFDDPIWVGRFFLGAACGSFVGAIGGTIASGADPWLAFFGSWFSTVLLGQLIVAPAILLVYHGRFRHILTRDHAVKAVGLIALASASIAVSFFQTRYSLLFLPLAMTVFATYLLGVAGAVGMLLMVSAGGTAAIMQGFMPPGFEDDPVGNIYLFQLYLLIVFASALPLATLLEKSRNQAKEIARRNQLLETAEAFANVGHWRFDLENEEIEWSDEMYRIYGLDPREDEPQNLNEGVTIPEEREVVREAYRHAIKTGEDFDLKLHIERADGAIRDAHATGFVERRDDRTIAVFGVLKDVTNHAQAMGKLQEAWVQAERDARKALRLSETDQLTGVANRRKLLTVLRREMEQAERGDRDLSIIMLDVDHFKAINDTHGHGEGDLVLQRIAEAGRACVRDLDLFGRLGGEEFLAILPGANIELASLVGERLRRAVKDLSGEDGLAPDRITISLGVAVHQKGSDENFFLQAADAALYQSKAAGRNRLTVASANAA